MIAELETLSKLPSSVRQDVERYCEWRGCAYSVILSADRLDEWAQLKRVGLIHYLAARGYRLREIHIAAGVSRDFAYSEVQNRRKPDFPIRTTNYERLASCQQ